MSILYKKAQHYLFHGLSPESRSQTRWSCEDRVLRHGRSPSSSVHLQWVSWPWGPRSIYTFSWLSFQAKQKLNAINRKIPSTPGVMTFHNSDMKSPCLCRWGDYQNSARILRWYFGSWHCNYQCNTKYNTESDILMITLDAMWKLKPIRYIIRRQLHDTLAGKIKMGNVHESIQLHHRIEDTIDIRLLLILWSAQN